MPVYDMSTASGPVRETLTCEECSKEFQYAGRGRRPAKCPDCRPSRKPQDKAPDFEKGNKLAAQAASVLAGYWKQLGVLEFTLGLRAAPKAIAGALETYETQTRLALEQDPAMVKMILSNAGMSGRTAFIITQAMMALTVLPPTMKELGEVRAARKAQRETQNVEEAAA